MNLKDSIALKICTIVIALVAISAIVFFIWTIVEENEVETNNTLLENNVQEINE